MPALAKGRWRTPSTWLFFSASLTGLRIRLILTSPLRPDLVVLGPFCLNADTNDSVDSVLSAAKEFVAGIAADNDKEVLYRSVHFFDPIFLSPSGFPSENIKGCP